LRARGPCRRHRRPFAGDAIRHGLPAWPDSIRRHRLRRSWLIARRLHCFIADRADPDVCGRTERLARQRVRAARREFRPVGSYRHLERHNRADRAHLALCAAGADPDRSPHGPAGDARDMSDTATTAPDMLKQQPGGAMRFYGIWLIAGIALIVLPLIFSSGSALTSFSLIGIAIIVALSYNILLGQTGLLSFGHAVHYGLGGFLAVHMMNAVANY